MTKFFFLSIIQFSGSFIKKKNLAHGTKWIHPENNAVFYKFQLFLPKGCLLIFFIFIIFPFFIINRNIHCILWLILNLTTQWSQNENDNANFVYSKRFRFKWCKIHECKIQKYIIHKCYIIIILGTFTKTTPPKSNKKPTHNLWNVKFTIQYTKNLQYAWPCKRSTLPKTDKQTTIFLYKN